MKRRRTLAAFLDRVTAPARVDLDMASPVALGSYRLAVDVLSSGEVAWQEGVRLPVASYETMHQALKDFCAGRPEAAQARAHEYLRDREILELMEAYAVVEGQLERDSASTDEAARLREHVTMNLTRTALQLMAARAHLTHRRRQLATDVALRPALEEIERLCGEVLARRQAALGQDG